MELRTRPLSSKLGSPPSSLVRPAAAIIAPRNASRNQARVTVATPGSAQTILVIGSDHRAGMPWKSAHTDTMMLVRLNPNSSTINVLSVPRDLEVQLHAHRSRFTGRLNAAYSLG